MNPLKVPEKNLLKIFKNTPKKRLQNVRIMKGGKKREKRNGK